MNADNICRVLIVDNKPEYAAQVAEKLEHIAAAHPDLLQNYNLEIELSNTAYFVARSLRESPPAKPPWDIIISDIYMPMPSRLPCKQVIEESADEDKYSFAGRSWPYWKYRYSWNRYLEGEIEHGGLHLAKTIKSLKEEGKDLSTLKLVLMSRRLLGDDRARLEEYQASGRYWFKYYDKADWERDNLFDWPASQLEPNIFQWALILAIAERDWEYWGDAVFGIVPDAEDFLGATLSSQMQKVTTEVRRIGSDPRIDTLLITGEVGTGKESIALLIHELRMKKLGLEGEFIAIDCSSIPDQQFETELFTRAEEAAGGTFFVDEVDKLPPHQQGRLYHLLKDKRLRSGVKGQALNFKAQLAICTASRRNLEELNSSGFFHDDLYLLLKDEHLHITPLRERPEDIIPLAETTLRKNTTGITLSAGANAWLKNYQWPRNARELINVLKVASRRSLTKELTESHLRMVVVHEAMSTATADITPNPEVIHQTENEEQETRAFKAEPPFTLHCGESVLVDNKARALPLAEDLYNVLKELVREEEGQHKIIKGKLTFTEVATAYKGTGSFQNIDEAQEIAHDFARNLRRELDDYSIDHYALIGTWKGHGYRMGNGWATPPFIYKSESSLLYTDNVEEAERAQRKKEIGRKPKLNPDY